MTIEVRQLLIRSQINPPARADAPLPGTADPRELARAKAEILAECKTWLREQLAAQKER
jgi:Family of unknown function (DUF5908)